MAYISLYFSSRLTFVRKRICRKH